MAGIDLPEDIIENIFSRLPVKSLIRFTCVSKKYQNLIFKGLNFAKTQYKLASGHRLLIPELGSLDLDTPSFDDIRKPNFHFLPPGGDQIPRSLGSCNGLMFVRGVWLDEFFVCNPSTGVFKKLPSGSFDHRDGYHGVGYLSATDDYKVVVNHTVVDDKMYVKTRWVLIFSLRARVWKRMEQPNKLIVGEGTLSNEALHWLKQSAHHEMIVFDLAEEEFRTRQLHDFDQDVPKEHFRRLGVSAGGSLCVLCYRIAACDSMDFWLLREYKVDELKLSDPEQQLFGKKRLFDHWTRFLVMKCCAILISTRNNAINSVRIDYKEGKLYRCSIEDSHCTTPLFDITKYEETLLWIDDPPDDPIVLDFRGRTSNKVERIRALEEEKRKANEKRRSGHGWTVHCKRT